MSTNLSNKPNFKNSGRILEEQRVKELYDNHCFGEFNYNDVRHNHFPLAMSEIISADKNSTLCDAGCGKGFWLETFEKSGFKKKNMTGIDISPKNIELIKSRGFEGINESILDLKSIQNNKYDYTHCNGVIHHTHNPDTAFSELVRITKSGGKIILAVYNQWNPYFYIVHKITFPIRWFYWNVSKRTASVFFIFWHLMALVASFCLFGKFADRATSETMMMDQVFTPYAFLFSKNKLRKLAENNNCELEKIGIACKTLMYEAIIKKK